jgi:hypothetical protein
LTVVIDPSKAPHFAQYFPNLEMVSEDGEHLEILEKSGKHIAYYRPGRSVYKGTVSGSQYEPARIVVAEIPEDKVENFEHYALKTLLEVPVRRR